MHLPTNTYHTHSLYTTPAPYTFHTPHKQHTQPSPSKTHQNTRQSITHTLDTYHPPKITTHPTPLSPTPSGIQQEQTHATSPTTPTPTPAPPPPPPKLIHPRPVLQPTRKPPFPQPFQRGPAGPPDMPFDRARNSNQGSFGWDSPGGHPDMPGFPRPVPPGYPRYCPYPRRGAGGTAACRPRNLGHRAVRARPTG